MAKAKYGLSTIIGEHVFGNLLTYLLFIKQAFAFVENNKLIYFALWKNVNSEFEALFNELKPVKKSLSDNLAFNEILLSIKNDFKSKNNIFFILMMNLL